MEAEEAASEAASASLPTMSHSISPDSSSSSNNSLDKSSDSSSNNDNSNSSSSALQQRLKHYGPNAALSYDQPLLVERGEGCYLFDDTGRAFLDCVNNVAHVGHGNAEVRGQGSLAHEHEHVHASCLGPCSQSHSSVNWQSCSLHISNVAGDSTIFVVHCAQHAHCAASSSDDESHFAQPILSQ